MKKLLLWIVLLAGVAGGAVATGLADPLIAWRVRSALVDAGIGEERAACMAERMVDRLTLVQIWKIRQGMAAQDGEPSEDYGLGELIKRLRRVDDGEAVAVLTTSAGLCALGIG